MDQVLGNHQEAEDSLQTISEATSTEEGEPTAQQTQTNSTRAVGTDPEWTGKKRHPSLIIHHAAVVMSIIRHQSLSCIIRRLSFISHFALHHSSFTINYSSFVTHDSSFVFARSSIIIHPASFIIIHHWRRFFCSKRWGLPSKPTQHHSSPPAVWCIFGIRLKVYAGACGRA